MIKAYKIINNDKYNSIYCSISGGADSDIMIDICNNITNKNISYVWFDTGLEYQATKEHLKYLENKYNIKIKRIKAYKSIPTCCKEYGQPFLSKYVSDMIQRLQRHNFTWEDDTFDNLCKKYPKCIGGLKWWCNYYEDNSHFNILRNAWLKEYMLYNKINFNVSSKCCEYAKKRTAKLYEKDSLCDLSIIGVRKSEGGIRATSYKNCFSDNSNEINKIDQYRPLFFYNDKDKKDYENHYGIIHSKCYTEYGLCRTGCAGCPFGKDFEFELGVINKHEPKLFKAVNNIFGDSYKYLRQYNNFKIEMNKKHGSYANYLRRNK